ncbi:MAG: hypothetical protein LAO21_15300 [Acidobacteriia bacterium]|nr:hypothetical protein [Terriglobia bacterium]
MLKKTETKILMGIAVLAAVCMWGSPSYAAVNFTLTITPSTISFPDANPTTTAQIPANSSVAIKVTTSYATNTNWSVHFLANGDLRNSVGTSTIPIANITWTATLTGNSCLQGCSCVAGTMSSTAAQDVIRGRGNTPTNGFNCNTNFLLKNQWGYITGSYTQTITVVTASP